MRLHNKIAIVTGAAQGIGEAISRAFAAEGAIVCVTDINVQAGNAVARAIGESATFERLDVREEQDWREVTERVVLAFGRLDILVNNAAVTGFDERALKCDPENTELEDWRAVHRTNLDGVFLGCKYAIRAMRPHGDGAIVNISSRAGLVGIPGLAAYSSSKAGVRNYTKTVALYCAEQGLNIRCNSIHPAGVLTPMWEPVLGAGPDREARVRELIDGTPLRRFGRSEEVAAVAMLLASDEAAYMTGAEINIDGGILAGSVAFPSLESR